MRKAFLAVAVLGLIIAFAAFDVGGMLTLDNLRSRQAAIQSYYETSPLQAAFIYFLLYVAVTAVSFPGAAVMSLAAGALFGLWRGLLIVSFASSVGALAAFAISRHLLRDAVQARLGERLRAVDAGIERDGPFYLFAMRLVPAIPFFLINILMGLTAIRTWTFYWVSQLGMLAGTLVYVNAGTQLGRIHGIGDILSPVLLGSFLLLAIFPFAARSGLEWLRSRKRLAPYPKPAHFDCNLVVIGGGSAGLVTAYVAAVLKAKVALIERDRMGGECLNAGCVPSKSLIRTARLLAEIKRAEQFGIRTVKVELDFSDIMARVRRVIAAIAPHDSVDRYTSLGVECVQGEARIRSPYSVEVAGASGVRTITTRAIVIATGARPVLPPIPGIDAVDCLTSDTIWSLRELPPRLVVLGGGPAGCEFAQCFARFGAQVTQIEILPRILAREDAEVSERVSATLASEGVCLLTGHKAIRFAVEEGTKVLYAEHGTQQVRLEFDRVLCATGRKPNVEGLGLEQLGFRDVVAEGLEVDAYLRTCFPAIYACGDVLARYQFTHAAAHTAWYAALNALFGRLRHFRVDYAIMPWCTFTSPEVARVGLNETEARAQGIAYEVTTYELGALDRALIDEAACGFVKVLTVPGKDHVLGATIVAEHAAEMITEFVAAMKHGIGLNAILATIHVYPTFSEANKYVSGQWKRAHAPERVLRWAQRYHAWMRG